MDVTEMIPWAKPYFLGNERDIILDAFESTWISGGEYIDKFEFEFARAIGTRHAAAVSNGTTALHLAMVVAGVGPGDEVIVPGFTFVAPANTAIMAGAKPIFVDVEPDTWLLDVEEVRKNITNKTKAIVPVHIYGNVCDMQPLLELAEEHDIFVIEDVAEAAFSTYKDKCAGSFGHLGCFSFQATKTITMGEGGAVLTNDGELDAKLRVIRSHGMRPDKRYWHDMVGYNYRLTNLQAALGYAQLMNVSKITEMKRRVYARYLKNLSDIDGIQFQHIKDEVEPVIWAVAMKIVPQFFKGDRDHLIGDLLNREIETRPGFYPCNLLPMYNVPSELPVSEEIGLNVISPPSYPSLSDDEIDKICDSIRKFLR